MLGGFKNILAIALASFTMICIGAENTLNASFENGNISLEAKNGQCEGKTDNPPAFADGIAGQALRLEKNSLSFPAFGNIDINKGTLAFWIRPVDWGDSLAPFIPLVALDGGLGDTWQLLLYYVHDNSGKLLDFRMKVPGNREIIAQFPAKSFQQGEWNHIALSWNDMEMRINLNGEKGIFQSYGLPIQRKNQESHRLWFMPDNFWRKKNIFTTDLDEIRIFDGFMTESEVKQLYMAHVKNADTAAEGTIPRASAKVNIDGRLEKGEWDDASRFPLAIMVTSKMMYSRQAAWVMLKNDGNNLLAAFEIEGRITENKAKPNARANTFSLATLAELDVAVSGGNSLQYFIYPNGAWAKLIGPQANWSAETLMKSAACVTEKGWTAEISIPLSELEVTANVLKANFGIRREDQDIEMADDRWLAWNASGKGTSFLSMAASLTLDAPACRVESLGCLENGIIAFSASKGVSLTVKDLVEGTLKNYDIQTSDKLPWAGISEVSIKGKGIRWTSNVLIKELASLKTVCHGNDRIIDFEISLLEGDRKLEKALKDGKLLARISLTDKQNKTVVGREANLTSIKTCLPLSFPKLKEGYYQLNLNVCGDDINFSTSRRFGVPEMDFIGTREGLDEIVPFPWAKPSRDAEAVQTNFHKFVFGGKVFPEKAWSFKQPVLVDSSDFYATVDGRPTTFTAVEKEKNSDTYESLVSAGQLKSADEKVLLSWKRVIDYDGLVKVDFSIEPADKPVLLEYFGIDFTIPEAAAKIALTPSIDIAWEKSGAVVTGEFFIGTTGKRGFAVFTDNNANYVFPKDGRPFRMKKQMDGSAKFTVKFIDGKAKLTRKAEYTLAVMATPGKPPRADWRRLHGEGWLAFKGQNMAVRGWSHEKKEIGFYRCNYMAWPSDPASTLKNIEDYRRRGIDCVPYSTSNMIPDENPLYDYFAKDWERAYHGEAPISSPGTDFDGTKYHLFVPVCQNVPQYRDYLCYYTARNMDRFGYKGIYFDAGGTTMTNRTFNLVERERVLTPDRPVEVINIFGTRELYKRLYKLIKKRYAKGYLYIHNWRNFHPAFMSFVDMTNPGEEYMHSFPVNNNVYMNDKEFSSPGLWRYNYNSETMGVAIQFLAGFNFHPRIKEWFKRGLFKNKDVTDEMFAAGKSMFAMCLLHDVQISGAGYPPMVGLWETLDKQDISSATFHPHWEQKELTTDNGDVVVSYYDWQGSARRLIVLGNLKDDSATVKLSGTVGKLSEAWPGNSAFSADTIQIDGYSFRLLEEK